MHAKWGTGVGLGLAVELQLCRVRVMHLMGKKRYNTFKQETKHSLMHTKLQAHLRLNQIPVQKE